MNFRSKIHFINAMISRMDATCKSYTYIPLTCEQRKENSAVYGTLWSLICTYYIHLNFVQPLFYCFFVDTKLL